jgi:disulfide bond formation protein DsbB
LSPALARILNLLALFGLSVVLLVAFWYQVALGELPCPLCLLQRVGLTAAGIGLALNLVAGSRPGHYAMTILSALAGAAVSVRQTLLHIVPGTGSYGSALFGMHFYTWALLVFVAIMGGAALMLMFEKQFAGGPPEPAGRAALAALALFAGLALLNGLSTLGECGVGLCPDDPTGYEFLPSIRADSAGTGAAPAAM